MAQTLLLLAIGFLTVIGIGCLLVALDDLVVAPRLRRAGRSAAGDGAQVLAMRRRSQVGKALLLPTPRTAYEPQLFARRSLLSPDQAAAARLTRR